MQHASRVPVQRALQPHAKPYALLTSQYSSTRDNPYRELVDHAQESKIVINQPGHKHDGETDGAWVL